MDITMTDRIDKIRAKGAYLAEMRRSKENAADKRKRYLRHQIKELSQHFDYLVNFANELQDNGFSLNDHRSYFGDTSSFCTDGITHSVGFFTRNAWAQKKEIIGFGIECGGAWGNVDLLIDFDGNVITKGETYSNGKFVSMEKFVEEFPEFIDRFIAYVDKITK